MNVLYDFDDGKYMANFLFGDTFCKVVMVKGDPGEPTDAQVKSAVYEYLEEHPNTFNPEGEYEDFTAGNANQLTSNIYTEDATPYIFRAVSDSSVEVGNREIIEQITGGTVAWNQLYGNYYTSTNVPSGVTITGSGVYVDISGTPSSNADVNIQYANSLNSLPANHVVIILHDGTAGFSWNRNGFNSKRTSNNGFINKHTSAFDTRIIIHLVAGTAYSIHTAFRAFDLTQMFGAEIADYILAQETATAGAGVRIFQSLFPSVSATPYNAGELMSVKTSARETVGKNLLNVTNVTVSSLTFNVDSDGYVTASPSNTDPRVWSYANCQWYATLPKGTYYLDFWCSKVSTSTNRDIKIIIPEGTYLGSAFNYGESGSVSFTLSNTTTVGVMAKLYESSIRMQIRSADAPTGYVPYTKHTYPLSPIELRGIPKLVSSKIQYDGDIYKADGSVTRRYGYAVLDGSADESWGRNTSYGSRYFLRPTPWNQSMVGFVSNNTVITTAYSNICITSAFKTQDDSTAAKSPTYPCMGFWNDGAPVIRVEALGSETITTVDAFRTWLSAHPIYLVYELASPTTETTTPYTETQICDADGTEEFIDDRDVQIPVGHKTKYPTDQVKKLDGLPSDFSTLIAPTESGTASRNYSVGSFLIMNNQLYKVTSAIASGAAITVGTNVTATTLAEQIIALLNR